MVHVHPKHSSILVDLFRGGLVVWIVLLEGERTSTKERHYSILLYTHGKHTHVGSDTGVPTSSRKICWSPKSSSCNIQEDGMEDALFVCVRERESERERETPSGCARSASGCSNTVFTWPSPSSKLSLNIQGFQSPRASPQTMVLRQFQFFGIKNHFTTTCDKY